MDYCDKKVWPENAIWPELEDLQKIEKDLHRYYLKNPSKFYKKSRFANDRIITYNLAKGQFEENIQKNFDHKYCLNCIRGYDNSFLHIYDLKGEPGNFKSLPDGAIWLDHNFQDANDEADWNAFENLER